MKIKREWFKKAQLNGCKPTGKVLNAIRSSIDPKNVSRETLQGKELV
jgi:hypothetical protein